MIVPSALPKLIPALKTRPLRHTYFRATQLKYHSDALGRNRPINAQRFNVRGGARVLYVGDDQVTCLHEVMAFGTPARSLAVLPVEVELMSVLDLHDRATQMSLLITQQAIQLNFRRGPAAPPTDMQVLGEALAASGQIDGLLYPSVARPKSLCLAIFEAGVATLQSRVEVNDPANGISARLP